MKCGDCKHWIVYRPIGGFLPVMYEGLGDCYPDGVKGKTRTGIRDSGDDCNINRFEKRE